MRVWGAYRKFGAFDYLPDEAKEPSPQPKIESRRELASEVYPNAVECALEAIKEGNYEKIVLARGIELLADRPWQPLDTLNRPAGTFRGLLHLFLFGRYGQQLYRGDARAPASDTTRPLADRGDRWFCATWADR
jgi:menaquinone-specific isochorismate synthase